MSCMIRNRQMQHSVGVRGRAWCAIGSEERLHQQSHGQQDQHRNETNRFDLGSDSKGWAPSGFSLSTQLQRLCCSLALRVRTEAVAALARLPFGGAGPCVCLMDTTFTKLVPVGITVPKREVVSQWKLWSKKLSHLSWTNTSGWSILVVITTIESH